MLKFSKFTASPIDVFVFKCPKIFRWDIGKIVRYLPVKKISAPSQIVATPRIAPKICQGQPQHLADIVPDFIQIGSLSAEL